MASNTWRRSRATLARPGVEEGRPARAASRAPGLVPGDRQRQIQCRSVTPWKRGGFPSCVLTECSLDARNYLHRNGWPDERQQGAKPNGKNKKGHFACEQLWK